MIASEDVQYFQFDEQGNMFVFQPGAGFTGPSLKVQPGFDMKEVTELSQKLSVSCEVSEVSCKSERDVFDMAQVSSAVSTLETNTVQSTPFMR